MNIVQTKANFNSMLHVACKNQRWLFQVGNPGIFLNFAPTGFCPASLTLPYPSKYLFFKIINLFF